MTLNPVDLHTVTSVADKAELRRALRHAIEDRGPDPRTASVSEQIAFLGVAEEAFRETISSMRVQVTRMNPGEEVG